MARIWNSRPSRDNKKVKLIEMRNLYWLDLACGWEENLSPPQALRPHNADSGRHLEKPAAHRINYLAAFKVVVGTPEGLPQVSDMTVGAGFKPALLFSIG